MKLPVAQLTTHLKKSLAPIFIVCGDETLLVEEAADLIRHGAQQNNFLERERIAVDSTTEWGENLLTHAKTFSLFATKRLLELDLTTIKLSASMGKFLQEYAQNPSEHTVLLIRTHKLDSKTENTQWYKAVDKIAVIIPIWPISTDQLPAWIVQRAKKFKLNLTPKAAEFLAQQIEGNLLAASQELEKLSLLELSDTIDQPLLENIIMDNSHFDIFSLVDSALAGKSLRCLKILSSLAAEDAEPILILWACAREIRIMAELATEVQQGISLSTLFTQFRIWEKRQGAVRAFLQRHHTQNCWNLLIDIAKIDRSLKGVKTETTSYVWNELENLILKMSSPGISAKNAKTHQSSVLAK